MVIGMKTAVVKVRTVQIPGSLVKSGAFLGGGETRERVENHKTAGNLDLTEVFMR